VKLERPTQLCNIWGTLSYRQWVTASPGSYADYTDVLSRRIAREFDRARQIPRILFFFFFFLIGERNGARFNDTREGKNANPSGKGRKTGGMPQAGNEFSQSKPSPSDRMPTEGAQSVYSTGIPPVARSWGKGSGGERARAHERERERRRRASSRFFSSPYNRHARLPVSFSRTMIPPPRLWDTHTHKRCVNAREEKSTGD